MDLATQNPWWRNSSAIEDDEKVKQALSKNPKVLYEFKEKENKIILGPRQTGKTTMLKLLIYDLIKNKDVNPKDILYFSCEPLNKKDDIIELIKAYDIVSLEAGRKYIFLDEVTQIEGWELALKYILETELSKNKLIIVTGSNALMLKHGSERLPGRNIKTELFLPLSFREFLLHFGSDELKVALKTKLEKIADIKEVEKLAAKLLPFSSEIESKFLIFTKTGGYLKAIFEYFENSQIKAETYETYVKWILGDLNKLKKHEHIFKNIVFGIIKKYGEKFSLHSMAEETEIKTHVTVDDYISTLQTLLLINNLYQADISKKIPLFKKEKKCYFLDPFQFSVLKGYISGNYQDYSEECLDRITEGIVCEALARIKRRDLDISSFLWFFLKDKETDFVYFEKELVGIELKYQNKVLKSDFANYYTFKKRILLSKKTFDKEDELLTIPVHLFLAMIG